MDMQDDVDDYGTVRPERTYQLIQFALRDGVARLTLNRPPANVLSVEMMEEINAALESLEYRKDVKVVVLSATGKYFSPGFELTDHLGDRGYMMLEAFRRIFENMARIDKPLLAVVAVIVLVSALFIAVQAVREIRTPHLTPAPWTLLVLVGVVSVKAWLSRHVGAVGEEIGSHAVRADASHHLSDAITSAAAFIGISIALLGSRYRGGTGWESADDWAALLASLVIGYNGVALLRPAIHDLMDRAPGKGVVDAVRRAAESVPEVMATEKLAVRRTGLVYRVTLHVQASEDMTLHDAHVLSGKVKSAIRTAEPRVDSVLVHMEPYDRRAAPPSAR